MSERNPEDVSKSKDAHTPYKESSGVRCVASSEAVLPLMTGDHYLMGPGHLRANHGQPTGGAMHVSAELPTGASGSLELPRPERGRTMSDRRLFSMAPAPRGAEDAAVSTAICSGDGTRPLSPVATAKTFVMLRMTAAPVQAANRCPSRQAAGREVVTLFYG